jgi:O-antigen ligase
VLTLLLVPTVALSHLSHGDTWNARLGGIEAVKAWALFALTVSIVNTPAQLRVLLLGIAASVLAVTVLAIANYHSVIDIAALTTIVQNAAGEDGAESVRRLCATGIFNDPNDYALVLVLCMSVCVFGAGDLRLGSGRLLAWIAFGVFGYALVLTHSRGGVLSAIAAGGAYVVARVGWRNALPLVIPLAGVLLIPSWGRQTDLNLADPEDTFQARLDLWSQSLDVFRANPIFGLGQGRLTEEIGQVTHNSFLHAFAELGVLGGVLFIGAFFLTIRGLCAAKPANTEQGRLRACVLAITVAYAVGMLALSRCYTAPVQLILGLATATLVISARDGQILVPRVTTRCLGALAGVGVVFLGATYLFVRIMIHRV